MSVYDLNAFYTDVTTGFLSEARKTLLSSYARIEHCLKQLSDDQLWRRPQPEMNAIANLLLHLAGNLEQWIIAPIENRPAIRNRPAEFAQRTPIPKTDLQSQLQTAITRAAAAIATLTTSEQLLQPRAIQGHNTNILTALFHAITHLEGHSQEIISMTRQLLGPAYVFLWVPKSSQQISAAGS